MWFNNQCNNFRRIWIWVDPDSNCQAGSGSGSVLGIRILKVKLSIIKIHFFQKKFKNKIPTFWVENKNFSQNFVFALKKLVFCILDPDWKKSRIRIRKKRIRIRSTAFFGYYKSA